VYLNRYNKCGNQYIRLMFENTNYYIRARINDRNTYVIHWQSMRELVSIVPIYII